MGIVSRKLVRESLRVVSVLLLATFLLVSCQSAHAISITTTTLPVGQLNASYSATIQSAGGGPKYSWTIVSGSLPSGLTLNNPNAASTTITGTPSQVGSSTFTVKVTGGSGFSNTKTLSITVDNMAVSVSGNEIQVNGTQGVLNGVVFVGIDNTSPCVTNFPYYNVPWNDWQGYNSVTGLSGAAAELEAAKQMGANAVRFQVALDELYEPAPFDQTVISNYITTVANAVALARSMNLAVDVSMQWEKGTAGYPVIPPPPQPPSDPGVCDDSSTPVPGEELHGDPGDGTNGTDPAYQGWAALLSSSAWQQNTAYTSAAVNFNNDPGVMLEVYNEPNIGSDQLQGLSTNWSAWQAAMNGLVTNIRGDGAKNVLIIPGLAGEKILDATAYDSTTQYGGPGGGESIYTSANSNWMVSDTLSPSQLIYAVHPYPHVSTDGSLAIGYFSSTDWDNLFGGVAQNMPAPVMITEWFSGAKDSSNCWNNTAPNPEPFDYSSGQTFYTPTIATDLFSWLPTAAPSGSTNNANPMSMFATGFDVENFWLSNLPTTTPYTPPSSYTPTIFDSSFKCGQVSGGYEGPGTDLQNYYQSY